LAVAQNRADEDTQHGPEEGYIFGVQKNGGADVRLWWGQRTKKYGRRDVSMCIGHVLKAEGAMLGRGEVKY
jgi:hypothetical protein